MTSSPALGSGIAAVSPQRLREALDALPEGATLFKLYVTGNLAVLLDGEQIGYLDLAAGADAVWSDWRT